MIRLWHLILSLLVVFTAAHVYFGIPGGITGACCGGRCFLGWLAW